MSVDTFLGLPMNITSYAVLQYLISRITGYTPGLLTGFLEDVHIYENHITQVNEQLLRKPLPSPKLKLSDKIEVGYPLNKVEPEDIWLEGYTPHPPISAPMAV